MAVVVLEDTHKLLREKIQALKDEIRENSNEIQEAAAQGDLSENAEYDSAKEKQSMLHYKLNQLQMYSRVEIYREDDIETDRVSYGTKIKLKELNSGEIRHYTVVGPAEYELENYSNIMTYTSPLAKALMGKEKGEVATIEKPDKQLKFEILEIESALSSNGGQEEES